MRYEKKYQIDHLPRAAVEQMLQLHPAGFRRLFPNRQVNNIYYDTSDYQTFRQNVDGVPYRKKFRLRWYGPDTQRISQPRLEVKIKRGELGAKLISPFPDSIMNQLTSVNRQVNHLLLNQKSGVTLLQPTLVNHYLRSYWATPNGCFRLTVDDRLQFRSPLNSSRFYDTPVAEPAVILEIKYAATDDRTARFIFDHLPFRQTKKSKYGTGLLLAFNH